MKTAEQTTANQNEIQNRIAEEAGAAIVLVDENSIALSVSNNNSMCAVLYNSEEFAPECAKFCGIAFQAAAHAGQTVSYKCYAGLECLAVPLPAAEKPLAAIVGRTFLKAEDYRKATERAAFGDWQKFALEEFFANVLINESIGNLESAAEKVKVQSPKSKAQSPKTEATIAQTKIEENPPENWRSLFNSLLDLSYRQACLAILHFVADRYDVPDAAWLERGDDHLKIIYAVGKLKTEPIQVEISTNDERLLAALRDETSLELGEQQDEDDAGEPQTLELFPVAVGGEIRAALIVGEVVRDARTKHQIARFCQTVAAELEILRLREQLARRSWLERAVEQFNQSLRDIDSEDFWAHLNGIFAELMRAERSSLLLFDETSNSFTAKAATGIRADIIKRETENLGARVAGIVMRSGEAAIVEDVKKVALNAAPADWNYKSDSFISFPIAIGDRKIGVLNVTDKADGDAYNRRDAEMLAAIMPQIAVLIDRANLKNKAGEYAQLSVTDALTGLLNRRYLDERLSEEIKRSNRHGFPMSFMMIDVDKFKLFNDDFGHQAGDAALQIVALCLKDALRGADVAVRYGGEEFSILLPQTTSAEAAIIAERVREKVSSTVFPHRKVTISVGVASCSPLICTAEEIIKAADIALYEAKHAGRNNVKIFESLELI